VHLSEGNFPANLQTMHGDLFSFCREAAQFNKWPAVDAGIPLLLAFERHWAGTTEAER